MDILLRNSFEEEEQEWEALKKNLYVSVWVEILDQIPFEDDQLDEDELRYYFFIQYIIYIVQKVRICSL